MENTRAHPFYVLNIPGFPSACLCARLGTLYRSYSVDQAVRELTLAQAGLELVVILP